MKKCASCVVISVILVVVMVFAFPTTALAVDNTVYYSDLFYGYSTDYLLSDSLNEYANTTADVMSLVYNEYVNSPSFFWTKLSGGISAATNPKQLITWLSDAYADTEFNYNEAVDRANLFFASELFPSTEAELAADYGKTGKILKFTRNGTKIWDQFIKDYDIYTLPNEQIMDLYMQRYAENSLFIHISTAQIMEIKKLALPKLGDFVKDASDMQKFLTGLTTAMAMEEVRLDLIDDILAHAPADSVLYEGMSRLKGQLKGGFVTYFAENYIVNTVLEKLSELAVKYIAGNCTPYVYVSAVLEIGRTIIFDWLLGVASVEEFLVQTILYHYVLDMRSALESKVAIFEKQFNATDVLAYESMFDGLVAAVNAGLSATEKLTLSSNEDMLNEAKRVMGKFTYEVYIYDIMDTIAAITPGERMVKSIDWTIITPTTIINASNEIVEGGLYLFDGAINGDITVNADLVILGGTDCEVKGAVTVCGPDWGTWTVTIEEKSRLTVYGNMIVKDALYRDHYIYNNGVLEIYGNLSLKGFSSRGVSSLYNNGELIVKGTTTIEDWGFLYQSSSQAQIFVGGDFNCVGHGHSAITAGTLTLNGTRQQKIKNLSVYNLTIKNPYGILYESDILLYGHFTSNNSPLRYGEYWLCLEPGASLASGTSNYGNVKTAEGECLSTGAFCVDNLLIENNLTIPNGVDCEIKGTVTICGMDWGTWTVTIEEKSRLTVYGNMIVKDALYRDHYIYNNGVLEIYGNLSLKGFSSRGVSSLYNNGELKIKGVLNIGNYANLYQQSNGTLTYLLAEEVEKLINTIGDVTLDSEELITTIRGKYNALPAAQKPYVDNYAALTAAETKLNALITGEKEVATEVVLLINAIGTVTPDSGDAVIAARTAYDALTENQKKYVTNYAVLVKAEEILACDHDSLKIIILPNDDTTHTTTYQCFSCEMTYQVMSECFDEKEDLYCDYCGGAVPCEHKNTAHNLAINANGTHANITTCKLCKKTVVGEYFVCSDVDNDDKCDTCGGEPKDYIAVGYCGGESDGTNLMWMLNDDGTLIVTGKGQMKDFESDSDNNIDIVSLDDEVDTASWEEYAGAAPWSIYGKEINCVVIEEGVTSIGNYAFEHCSFVNEVEMPDSLTRIGRYAFERTALAGRLEIGSGVTYIDTGAFSDCKSITEVVFPETLETIKQFAFSGCIGIGSDLYIPASVTMLDYYVFWNCTNIKNVYFYGAPFFEYADPFPVGTTIYYPEGMTEWTECRCYDEQAQTWAGYPLRAWSAQIEKFTVAGSNMTLGNQLGVNFLFKKADLTATGCTAIVTQHLADGTTRVTELAQADWSAMGSIYHKVPVRIAAKEMADQLSIEIVDADGNVLSMPYSTSVRDYAGRALASTSTTEYVRIMMIDMLNYGAAAQQHFGYNTADLANSILTKADQADATAKVECTNNQVKDSTVYGANLALDDKILLNTFFQGLKGKDLDSMYAIISFTGYDGASHEIRVEGSEFIKYGTSGDIYKIVVDDIVLADAKQMVTVTVYNADGSAHGSCSDCVESYVARAEENNADTYGLYANIMKFATSAYNYIMNR